MFLTLGALPSPSLNAMGPNRSSVLHREGVCWSLRPSHSRNSAVDATQTEQLHQFWKVSRAREVERGKGESRSFPACIVKRRLSAVPVKRSRCRAAL